MYCFDQYAGTIVQIGFPQGQGMGVTGITVLMQSVPDDLYVCASGERRTS